MSWKRCVVVLALFALSISLTPGPARATQLLLQTVEQMTYRADAVVRAVPAGEAPSVHWTNPDGTGLIVTTTRFRVLETLSGDVGAGTEIAVEHLGGKVGDMSMMVPGMAVFVPGEEVVLFARRGTAGQFHVLDLSMGKFEIARGTDGNQRLTRRDLQGAEVVGETPESPATLATLRATVGRVASRKLSLLRAGRPLPTLGSARDAIDEGAK